MLDGRPQSETAHNAPTGAERAILRMLASPLDVQTIGARFWSLVNIPGNKDDCWQWSASKETAGYGRFKIYPHVNCRAHRVAWAISRGESPGEMLVCHRCDNRSCVNPGHLFLGTHQDNMDDMRDKGRQRSPDVAGENNPRAKMTEETAKEAIAMMAAGKNNKQIAAAFGVSQGTISLIRRGKSWAHIPRPRQFSKYGSIRR